MVAACGATPAPQVITEKVVETVVVQGTPQIVEKEVTKVVETEKIITATPEPEQGPAVGGTLVYALSSEPDTLDVHKSGDVFIPCQFFGAGLVARDPKTGEFIPYLAKSWTATPDNMTYEFKLRDDVVFHNGAPLTAQDYAFTFMRAINPETRSPTAGQTLVGLAQAEATDDHTLVLHFAQPNPVLLNSMSNNCYLQPLPQAAVEQMGDDFGRNPIGVGPYKFKEWVTGEKIVLERNPDFTWGPAFTRGGPPYIQTIEFRIIPEYSTQLAGLESGDLDLVSLQTKDLQRIQDTNKFRILSTGLNGTGIHMEMNTTVAPFNDVRVRQALNYAVDRDTINQVVEGGHAQPLYGPLTPSTVGYWPGVEYVGYHYGVDKAKALLTEAGYALSADGVFAKDGQPLALTLVFAGNHQKVAEIVQEQFKAAGIQVELQQLEYGVLQQALSAGDFGIAIDQQGWPDAGILYVLFFSATIGGYNHSRVTNLDGLFMPFFLANGREAFNQAAGDIQRAVVENAYFVPIYAPMAYYAVSNKIQGPLDSPADRWLYLFDAYIETGPKQ
jgi:peptide/nickel transport system substrate-binding protein